LPYLLRNRYESFITFPKGETESMKLGVIGCGDWGKNLIRVFSELGVLDSIYDIDTKKMDTLRYYHKVKTWFNYEEMLKDKTMKAIVIATPAITHYRIAKEALLADKDVFVEKPLAMNYKEGKELVDLAKSKNRILMVGHLLVYHPAMEKLREMVSNGELGKINYVYSNRLNLGKLRTEENVFQSFAPHDISAILRLLGEEPVKVSYHEGTFISKNISDTTITFMEFPSGVKAHIFVSWLHPYKEQKLVVIGTKAMVVFDDLTAEKFRIYSHKIRRKNGKIPVVEKAEYEHVAFPALLTYVEPLRVECEHFVKCVTTRAVPLTDGEEALRVLRVLDVCLGVYSRDYFVHESSVVDNDVNIGKGTKIWHFSHILKGSRIGKNCNIGQNVVIGPNVSIGDGVKIQNNVSVYEGVKLEDDVFCGPSCVFTNVMNPRSHISRKHEFKKTIVRRGATIGANATILCGVTIGEYALVGAGAVVTRDVLPYSLVYGVPAQDRGVVTKKGDKVT